MWPDIVEIKGIHPGIILQREIKRLGLKNYELADSVKEYPQTISAILKGKRGINPNLSIKLGRVLNIAEEYFMVLQAYYDVRNADLFHHNETPNLDKIRKSIFWDTDFEKIDWIKNKKAVLKRVFERGNEIEIEEIISFYGINEIRQTLYNVKNDYLPAYNENLEKYQIL